MQAQTEYQRERTTLNALVTALQELPHAHAAILDVRHQPAGPDNVLDATIDLAVADRNVTLLIEVKKTVYPRDVREIFWQLNHAPNADLFKRKSNVIPLVAAESISTGARELLKAEKSDFSIPAAAFSFPPRGVSLCRTSRTKND